ncbi:MAG: DUF2188 domain-containing protein [Bryobacteraceae bacterium]
MVAKTYHVYWWNGSWSVRKEGGTAKVFRTQREAIHAARGIVKKMGRAQLAIHGADGRVRIHETYGIRRVMDVPKKSRLAKQIGRAVGQLAIMRLESCASTSGKPQK